MSRTMRGRSSIEPALDSDFRAEATDHDGEDTTLPVRGDLDIANLQIRIRRGGAIFAHPGVDLVHRRARVSHGIRAVEEEHASVGSRKIQHRETPGRRPRASWTQLITARH